MTERSANDSLAGRDGPPEEFDTYIAQRQKIWKAVVLRAGIKPG